MSLRRSEVRLRSACGLAGLAVLASGCASVGDPGVEIQALQAEIAFGVELSPEDGPVEPPTVAVDLSGEEDVFDSGGFTVPFRNRVPERFTGIPFRVEAPEIEEECPSAGIGASPERAASEEVEGEPKEGVYLWKRDIAITQTIDGYDIVARTTGFEKRLVRNVEVVGEATDPERDEPGRQFVFQTVRPDGMGNVLVEDFRVNTDPAARGANRPADPSGISEQAEGISENAGVPLDIPDDAQEQLETPTRIRVGEPNRGLTLNGVEIYDGNGQTKGRFDPAPPELLVPFPIEVGDYWTSTSTSPNGQTVRIEGSVSERRSVDACGTLLDGWLAVLDIIDASSAGAVQRHVELIVSTELGGMIVGQRITEDSTDEAGNSVRLEATYTIGQVVPDPLPDGDAQ